VAGLFEGDRSGVRRFAPSGPVSGHDHLKQWSSLPDLIGRRLLVEYCGRDDLAHAVKAQIQQTLDHVTV
jgi:hypothetical protein